MSRVAVAILSIVGLAGGAAAEPRRAGFAIIRHVDAALPDAATTGEIAAVLVGASWDHANPDKETSDWEGQRYDFHAGGEVELATFHIGGTSVDTLRWKVSRAGSRPVVTIGRRRYRLEKCVLGNGKTFRLCLF